MQHIHLMFSWNFTLLTAVPEFSVSSSSQSTKKHSKTLCRMTFWKSDPHFFSYSYNNFFSSIVLVFFVLIPILYELVVQFERIVKKTRIWKKCDKKSSASSLKKKQLCRTFFPFNKTFLGWEKIEEKKLTETVYIFQTLYFITLLIHFQQIHNWEAELLRVEYLFKRIK